MSDTLSDTERKEETQRLRDGLGALKERRAALMRRVRDFKRRRTALNEREARTAVKVEETVKSTSIGRVELVRDEQNGDDDKKVRVDDVSDEEEHVEAPNDSAVESGDDPTANPAEMEAEASELAAALESARELAAEMEKLATLLGLEHGVALSAELHAQLDLDLIDVLFDFDKLNEVVGNPERLQDMIQRYAAAEKRLNAAVRIANSYGDEGLLLHCLELLANIYNRTDCYDDLVRVVDAACQLGRTVPKVCILLDAYGKRIQQLFEFGRFEVDPTEEQTDPVMKAQNDELLKLNYSYWVEYQWLKEADEPGFDMDAWILRHKMSVFKSLIYVATIMSNTLLVGPDEKQHREAMEAADEAVRVAKLCDDSELLCVAEARVGMARFGRADDDGKRAIIARLRALEADLQPKGDELETTVTQMETQLEKISACQQCGAADAEMRCVNCKIARYCNRECQKMNWPKHKTLCKKLTKSREQHLKELQDKAKQEAAAATATPTAQPKK